MGRLTTHILDTAEGKPAVELSFRFELPYGPSDDQPYLLCGPLDRVAADAAMWWCDGPVHVFLAHLAITRREFGLATEHLDAAVPIAQGLGDARSLRRIAVQRDRIPGGSRSSAPRLSEREQEVLRRLVAGGTNSAIAIVPSERRSSALSSSSVSTTYWSRAYS